MSFHDEIKNELVKKGANFVHFVDISDLDSNQNRGFPTAILFGKILTPEFIQKVANVPDYVKIIVENNQIHEDEFHNAEKSADKLADYIASYLTGKGFSAFSQSEDNLYMNGYFDGKTKKTPLPHKTIALRAGMGWIGKHNLLVADEFGSAISMCTVLTNAPLKSVRHDSAEPQCGKCCICVEICPEKAIVGNSWFPGITRDEMIDVSVCTTCLKCMALCPRTQKYILRSSK